MHELNGIAAIAFRDFVKLLRDPARIASTFIFPLLFIGFLGGSMQASLGKSTGYDFLTFVFTGVYAQTLFQSAALGVISLLEDRQNDFSQEIFVSPISRYSIIFGKVLGETLVALPQGLAIIFFGLLIGVPMGLTQILALAVVGLMVCLFSGSFGVLILSGLSTRRAASQIFDFILFPQFFTAGVFAPIQGLPWYLDFLSRISPLRYAVDLTRGLFYAPRADYGKVTLADPWFNLLIVGVAFALFLAAGTILFVHRERNR